ncbi:hypothetical protein NC653_032425 [Populus alba x Populus x berolinensis]|uniref:Uncharacterized protein n=1 Tax=Populus alba x Populus x berolinensis TaxID=444605 RepID=A0AAD6LR98_9ROSI|nr:hypothetical protein NC653_032425 [Populus alba x Populus x berolinensis]
MASTFVTVPTTRPFLSVNKTNALSLSQLKLAGMKRNSLRINAISKKWEPTKVVPQADRVLIRLEDLPEKSSGGVLLPKSAVKFERYLMGEVLSVGAEVGEVEAGKKVLFSDINAYELMSYKFLLSLSEYDVHSMPSSRQWSMANTLFVTCSSILIWEQMLSIAFAKLVICWPSWSDISGFLPILKRPTFAILSVSSYVGSSDSVLK